MMQADLKSAYVFQFALLGTLRPLPCGQFQDSLLNERHGPLISSPPGESQSTTRNVNEAINHPGGTSR